MNNYNIEGIFLPIFGTKGGVGKSTFVVNLAREITNNLNLETLIVDTDILQCGDINLLLGIKNKVSVIELLQNKTLPKPEIYEKSLSSHKSGLKVISLYSPDRPTKKITLDKFDLFLKFIKNRHQVVIFDCGISLNPISIKILEKSSALLLLSIPELLSIHKALLFLSDITNLHFPFDRVHLILNRTFKNQQIGTGIIKKRLKCNLLGLLPEDGRNLSDAVTNGTPVIDYNPDAPYSSAIKEIVRSIVATDLLKPTKEISLSAHKLHVETTAASSMAAVPLLIEDAVAKKSNRFLSFQENDDFDVHAEIKKRIHSRLLEEMDLRHFNFEELSKHQEKMLELRKKTLDMINRIIESEEKIKDISLRQKLAKEVLDETLGLGPLEDLLADPDISEIMVNRYDQIYVERAGKLIRVPVRFTGPQQLMGVIERIVAPIGRRIDEKTPMVDARLPDGSRVHAIIPPLAINGAILTIRKFKKEILSAQNLVEMGSLTKAMAEFLRACVQGRLNIIISGGTGTGKTTLLNILSSFIPGQERIITVEDSAELQLKQEHVCRLEARPPNLQGEGEVSIRELVRNTLRMRPDRIIVGECRGAEALDMLQAMNTGHDGSLTTIHANSPRDCLRRLETLVMFAGTELPSKAIREQIASAINLIVQLNRFSDGTRKITHITEVTGHIEGETISTQDIFIYKQRGVDHMGKVIGDFKATGLIPRFADKLEEKGIHLARSIFGTGEEDA